MPGKHTIRKKKQLSWEAVGHSLRSRTAQCVYVILAGAVILCILFMAAITPQRYDLKVGDISHTTITASKDVVDEISTARQRETAANQVEPSYIFKEDVAGQVMQDLATVLAQVSAVQQYGRRVLEQYAPGDPDKQAEYVFAEAELNYARSLLTQISLADYQLSTLLRATDQQMADLNENITSAVENTLNTTIREGYVNESIQYLQQVGGPKAGNGGDLCLYLVQLRAGQPIGYGFNAAAVDKLRNRNIIDGGEPQNQDCLDPAVADAIGYGVPPVGIALEQKAKCKIAPDFLKHARQQAADQGVSPRMGQHILRNAGAAAKENSLGHTFQYLGENNEGHRADNSRKQLCPPAEFELPYQKNQNRQPDTGCGGQGAPQNGLQRNHRAHTIYPFRKTQELYI